MATGMQPAFISYSRDDSEFVRRLAEDLKAAGAAVWLDQLDIAPGQRWGHAIQDALANCPRLLVILSPASASSTNVDDEVSFALEEKKTVIPVLYRECKVPFRLRPLQHVDFRSDYARGLKELLRTVAAEPPREPGIPATRLAPDPTPRRASESKISTPKPRISAARTAGMALFLLTALNFFNFIDRYILPGVQPLVQREFGVNDAQLGLLTTVFFFTYMIVAPLTGWLGDRFPRRPLIVGGALLWSLATLFTAFVHSYQTLLIRHAMVGIGEATFSIFAPAMLSDFYPEADRNRILSIFYITIPLGGAFGYLTGGILGQRFGWRMPFYVAALPGVFIALAFYFFVREPQRGSADSLAPTFNRTTVSGLFRNPAFWTATLGLAMWTFAVGGISTWLPTFLVRFGSMSVAMAGTVAGGLTVVDGLLGTIFGGWLAHRWLRTNHRALYLISAWGSVLAIPAAALVFFGPPSVFILGATLAEFFLFLGTGPLNAAIVNSVAAPIRATAISLNLLVIHALGDAFSPHLIGRVSDASGLRTGLSITLIALAASGVILFSGARFAPRLATSKDSHT